MTFSYNLTLAQYYDRSFKMCCYVWVKYSLALNTIHFICNKHIEYSEYYVSLYVNLKY